MGMEKWRKLFESEQLNPFLRHIGLDYTPASVSDLIDIAVENGVDLENEFKLYQKLIQSGKVVRNGLTLFGKSPLHVSQTNNRSKDSDLISWYQKFTDIRPQTLEWLAGTASTPKDGLVVVNRNFNDLIELRTRLLKYLKDSSFSFESFIDNAGDLRSYLKKHIFDQWLEKIKSDKHLNMQFEEAVRYDMELYVDDYAEPDDGIWDLKKVSEISVLLFWWLKENVMSKMSDGEFSEFASHFQNITYADDDELHEFLDSKGEKCIAPIVLMQFCCIYAFIKHIESEVDSVADEDIYNSLMADHLITPKIHPDFLKNDMSEYITHFIGDYFVLEMNNHSYSDIDRKRIESIIADYTDLDKVMPVQEQIELLAKIVSASTYKASKEWYSERGIKKRIGEIGEDDKVRMLIEGEIVDVPKSHVKYIEKGIRKAFFDQRRWGLTYELEYLNRFQDIPERQYSFLKKKGLDLPIFAIDLADVDKIRKNIDLNANYNRVLDDYSVLLSRFADKKLQSVLIDLHRLAYKEFLKSLNFTPHQVAMADDDEHMYFIDSSLRLRVVSSTFAHIRFSEIINRILARYNPSNDPGSGSSGPNNNGNGSSGFKRNSSSRKAVSFGQVRGFDVSEEEYLKWYKAKKDKKESTRQVPNDSASSASEMLLFGEPSSVMNSLYLLRNMPIR